MFFLNPEYMAQNISFMYSFVVEATDRTEGGRLLFPSCSLHKMRTWKDTFPHAVYAVLLWERPVSYATWRVVVNGLACIGSNTSSWICTLCSPMYAGCMDATVSIGYCIPSQTRLLGRLQYIYECYYSLNPAVTFPSENHTQNGILFHSYCCFVVGSNVTHEWI